LRVSTADLSFFPLLTLLILLIWIAYIQIQVDVVHVHVDHAFLIYPWVKRWDSVFRVEILVLQASGLKLLLFADETRFIPWLPLVLIVLVFEFSIALASEIVDFHELEEYLRSIFGAIYLLNLGLDIAKYLLDSGAESVLKKRRLQHIVCKLITNHL
jgi:hypothetical protein